MNFKQDKKIFLILILFIMIFATACENKSSTNLEKKSNVPSSSTEQKVVTNNQPSDTASQQTKKVEEPKSTEATEAPIATKTPAATDAATTPVVTTTKPAELKVHYIDVGQGDAILIEQGTSNMLIDAGTRASTNLVINYLHSQNIKKLDYLVLTHPDLDHVGGADAVIKAFDINTLYMTNAPNTTKTAKNIITTMSSKNLKSTLPEVDSSFKLGDAKCTILSPINSKEDDLNTYSIVIKVVFGNNKFLFTGDAQTANEQDMINKGFDLSADVIKIGDHGSNTSTSQSFLDKVNPKYAVISLGKNNDSGCPHKEVMTSLQNKNISVYRTDESSTIIATSDGNSIKFNTSPGSYNSADLK